MSEPTNVVRWACIGTGQIAAAMAQQLARMPDARRELICSASGKPVDAVEPERLKLGYARCAASVAALVADACVDVVYVASANTAHAAHCLAALRAGKHVLCEKPLTMSFAEAEALFEEAERRGVLLVDGIFSACLPGFDAIRAALPSIGRVTHVELHKKIRLAILRSSPIINRRDMGGGIFDGTGSYTCHALCAVIGAAAVAALTPEDVDVTSTAGPNGEVDWETNATVRVGGTTARLTHRAADDLWPSVVRGERGTLEFDLPRLQSLVVNGEAVDVAYAGPPGVTDLPVEAPGGPHGVHPGLGVEAACVHRAILAGETRAGTAALPLDVMRAVAHLMDLIRHQIPTHLHYRGAAGTTSVT